MYLHLVACTRVLGCAGFCTHTCVLCAWRHTILILQAKYAFLLQKNFERTKLEQSGSLWVERWGKGKRSILKTKSKILARVNFFYDGGNIQPHLVICRLNWPKNLKSLLRVWVGFVLPKTKAAGILVV